jgi:hypothetical protein
MFTSIKPKLTVICGCGEENHNLNDWTCHWEFRKQYVNGIWRAIRLFLTTKIVITWFKEQAS